MGQPAHIRFSLVSFVVLLVVSVTLATVLSKVLRSREIDAAIHHAEVDSSVVLLGALTPADFEAPMTGERLARFDEFVQQSLLTELIVMVKLWAKDRSLIYASDPEDQEAPLEQEPHLPRVLSGETSAHIHPAEESNAGETRRVDLFEVYTPVVFPGTTGPIGAFEIYEDYAAVSQRVDDMRAWVFGSVGFGFLVSYGSLVSVVWRGSRTIGRQRERLAASNEDLRAANEEPQEAHREMESRIEARTAELRRANAESRESEERYRLLMETSPGPTLVHSDGNIVYANAAAATLFGVDEAKELVGISMLGLLHEDFRETAEGRMQRVYREGVSTPAREVKVIRPDGEVRTLETVAAPMRYEGKPAALLVLSDTTERNALQEQLLQAQKMEVVGQLAGGMAHDFNNLLTPILGFAGLVKERLAQDDPGREFMEEIEHAAGRAGLARPPAPRLLPSAAHGAEGSRSE